MKNVLAAGSVLTDQTSRMLRLVSEEAGALDQLRGQLRDRHVRGAARKLLLSGQKGDSTSLMLNRQAATVGVVALCSSTDQSPLGPIYATIDSRRITVVIDWLTAYE